jgi:hypothetical protein
MSLRETEHVIQAKVESFHKGGKLQIQGLF